MSNFEIHSVEGHLDGTCFGLWDMSDPLCTKCLVTKYCEEKNKRGGSPQDSKIETDMITAEENDKLPDISPLEYMFELLESKFDATTAENDKAVAHYFTKDDKKVFAVIVSKQNGKLKLNSQTGSKVLDKLQSIEQAEEIVKEMIG